MFKVDHPQSRRAAGRLVLKTVYDRGTISRADIARTSHLSPPTVSAAVCGLLESGLLEEVGRGLSTGGKRPTMLRLVAGARCVIGLDLARGDFRGVITDLRGEVRHRLELPLRDRSGEAALALAYELCDALVAAADHPLLGIGVGAPGLVDAANGVVCHAVNVDWKGVPLAALLARRYDLPVHIANDCQVAAQAERTFGAATAAPADAAGTLAVINVGYGVGAGIVCDGQLLNGHPFGAGELGHVVVEPAGERCQCGQRGCLETVVSTRAIVRRLRSLGREPGPITFADVEQAYRAGDAGARRVVEETGRYLGLAVANLIAIVGPCRVLLAGPVAAFGPELLAAIARETAVRALPELARRTDIGFATVGTDIVLRGAAALVLSYEAGLL